MKKLHERIVVLLASGLYTGYSPFASGTVASGLAILLYIPLASLNTPTFLLFAYVVTLLGLTVIGIMLASRAEAIFNEKDSHKIVIDEIVGYFYAMFLLPYRWEYLIAAFFVFRIFDVIKPYPIRGLEKLPSGLGVMIDDVLAGVYTCIILHIIRVVWNF